MQNLVQFSFQNNPVRVVMIDGEPWWVAKDVCDVLEYAWSGAASIRHVPGEWKGIDSVPTPFGDQQMNVLSEQGLYFFVARSDKPKALPFQKWLAGDVVPSIRKTGSYSVAPVYKISREIVNWCLARGVGTIRMEDLSGIRLRGRRNRKDRGRSLHSWSFHQLQQFIAYKAVLAGMNVEWVVPANTSRACPVCGVIDKANRNGIVFRCKACGHKEHADVVGGTNISRAISGLAKVA